ncbi:hypothetical protein ACFXPY_47470 [Streptomyces sp. NPDC059153]
MDSITQLTQEQRTAFQPAASRYPHMSIAYTKARELHQMGAFALVA